MPARQLKLQLTQNHLQLIVIFIEELASTIIHYESIKWVFLEVLEAVAENFNIGLPIVRLRQHWTSYWWW
jgi:hypothetical protein